MPGLRHGWGGRSTPSISRSSSSSCCRYRQGIRCPADRGDCCLYFDLMVAPDRRHRLGLARRSHRPQEAADDLDRLVLGLQLHRRLLPQLRLPVLLPRACWASAWARSGRSAPRWRWKVADPLARLHGGRDAGIMGAGWLAVGRCLRVALRLHRLARPAVDRRLAGVGNRLRSEVRQRTARSGWRTVGCSACRTARSACAAADDLQGATCSATR